MWKSALLKLLSNFNWVSKLPHCCNHQVELRKRGGVRRAGVCSNTQIYQIKYIPMEWYHQRVFLYYFCGCLCTVFIYIWQQEIDFRTNQIGKHFSFWLLQCQIKNLFSSVVVGLDQDDCLVLSQPQMRLLSSISFK